MNPNNQSRNTNQVQQQESTITNTRDYRMDSSILIKNLRTNMTKDDFQKIFNKIGRIIHADIHKDDSNNTIGSAVIVFERRSQAVEASVKFNGYSLGVHPMLVKLMNKSSVYDTINSTRRIRHSLKSRREDGSNRQLQDLDAAGPSGSSSQIDTTSEVQIAEHNSPKNKEPKKQKKKSKKKKSSFNEFKEFEDEMDEYTKVRDAKKDDPPAN